MDNSRKEKYNKDESLEYILQNVNKSLSKFEEELLEPFDEPALPIVFIVGAQRSGTTLLMQLLIERFKVSYPSNFIARFWSCPFIGAKIYESFNIQHDSKSYRSDLGYTKGLEGPHEFGYFWKQWFPWLAYEEKNYDEIDYSRLQKELAAWQSVQNRPLVFKNIIYVSYHLKKIHEIFPNAFFLNISREDIYTIQSTYQSRLRLYNSEKKWFGIKPKIYEELLSLPAIDQIVRQVYHVKKDIRDQLKGIPNNRYLDIQYSELIESPDRILKQINKLVSNVYDFELNNEISPQLKNQNKRKVNEDIFNKIKERYNNYCL